MRRSAELGRRLRGARHAAGLSLVQACGTRLSQPHLSLVERGRRGVNADMLLHVAGRLGVSIGELLPPDLDPGDAEELLGAAEVLNSAGEHSRAIAVLRDLLPFLPADRSGLTVRCLIEIGSGLVRLHQYEFAEPYITEGSRLAEQTGDPLLVADAYNTFGQYYLEQNRPREALGVLERARRAAERGARPSLTCLARILANTGLAHRKLGDLEQAAACYVEAARIARTTGDTLQSGIVARNAAAVLTRLRHFDGAQHQLDLAREVFTALERQDLLTYVENGYGILYLETGDPERAIPHLEEAIRLAERVADDLRRAVSLTELGRAHLRLNSAATAEPHVLEAIRLSMRVNDPVEAARAETLRAEILAGRGELREAEAALQFVIPIFHEREQRKDLMDAYRLLGRVLQAGGRDAQASGALQRAVELARECLAAP